MSVGPSLDSPSELAQIFSDEVYQGHPLRYLFCRKRCPEKLLFRYE